MPLGVLGMALNRIRIGDILTIVDERNREDLDYPFFGININKEFMPSVANTSNVDRKKYKIIRKNRFVFSGMQTGRDNCIRIGIFTKNEPVLVSPAYTTFEITSDEIIPLYFFMIFNSKEKDRYGAFLSDSSVRSNLDWDRFCDIELEIPSIDIQKRYVAIYEGMLTNLHSFEKGLEDLKLVCDGFIEDLRRSKKQKLEGLLTESDERNVNHIAKAEKGVSIQKILIDTKAQSSDITKQKVVRKGYFAFNSNTSRNSDTISIALNRDEPCAVSNTYVVFSCEKGLLPEYLYLWFKRKEFDRYARFNSRGSARETISIKEIEQAEIAIPDIKTQQSIVDVLSIYEKRVQFRDSLKEKITRVCPVLIRGSILEAQGGV